MLMRVRVLYRSKLKDFLPDFLNMRLLKLNKHYIQQLHLILILSQIMKMKRMKRKRKKITYMVIMIILKSKKVMKEMMMRSKKIIMMN